jgi:NADH-quinone oxidoreductase subunit L
MAAPLAVLCLLAMTGGWIAIPVTGVFPVAAQYHAGLMVHGIAIIVPIIGVWLAYAVYISKQVSLDTIANSPRGRRWSSLWLAGWRFDDLYQWLWIRPYKALAELTRNEPVDGFYRAIARISLWLNALASGSQNGRLRWYATSMIMGVIVLLAIGIRGVS